jgi:hypothetical protein
MQTVVETTAFQRSAARAGMSEKEVDDLIVFLAAVPDAGDEIAGTGGCRKLRVAGRGKGKSGGYRVITFFTGPSLPLFLFFAYSKGDRANIGDKQKNALRRVTKEIVVSYGKRPMRIV